MLRLPPSSRLLVVVALVVVLSRAVPVYDAKGLFVDRLTHEDRARLRDCPCPSSSDELSSASLCLPVDFAGKKPRKEVFAFSVATDDRWKRYDWGQVRTAEPIRCCRWLSRY